MCKSVFIITPLHRVAAFIMRECGFCMKYGCYLVEHYRLEEVVTKITDRGLICGEDFQVS